MSWLHVLMLAVTSGLWLLYVRQHCRTWTNPDYRWPTLRDIRRGGR